MATHTVLSPSPLHTTGATDAVMTQCWMLAPGRALHFQADQAVQVQVTQGRVWATLDGPHAGVPNDLGDLILQAGTQLTLRRGQRLLVESWGGKDHDAASRLVWTPAAQAVGAVPVLAWREAVSALAAWFAEAGRLGLTRWLGLARGSRFARLGRLGTESSLQCQAGPGCHGVG
jgi:hypothetical protein